MADFHFLRPWWLAALPAGVWLIWLLLRGRAGAGGWRGVVDAPLRRFVLADPEVLRESLWPLVAAIAAWAVAVFALAGPAWERLPVPAFRSDEALVVALDLSRSMDASDVEPSRLARAKLKLLDLLARRTAGQTALVVFSTHAFTVTPLTTDTRTISSLATSVSTEIMPTQGSSVAAGLEKSAALLHQTGVGRGDVLLITDADVAANDLDAARALRRDGFAVSVLAVGTEQGAPIPQAQGGFVTDGNGQVVLPQVDIAGLQRLAAAGGGRFARLAPTDRDLDILFPSAAGLPLGATLENEGETGQQADVWRDRGAWLALLVLPFAALAFRRGWIAVVLLTLLLPTPRAQAFEWRDLWLRRDQQGYEALQSEQAERAAKLFESPEWRGAAQYKAGAFKDSAATLDGVDTADGHYNRGNALAKSGELQAAVDAYDRALELDPSLEDAAYNRDLVQKLLDQKKQEEQQQKQQQQQQAQNQDQQDENKQQGGKGDSSDDAQSDPSRRSQDRQAADERDQSGQDASRPEQQAQEKQDQGEPGDEQQQQQPDQRQANADEHAPGAEDVEKWASEQAAEQWLRRVPQDPGGLLRRKFLYQYQRLGVDQDGKRVQRDERTSKPW
jgi:Ca-activated chloride channel family protein